MSFAHAGQWGPDDFIDNHGIPLVGATVEVRLTGGGLAALWSNRTKTVALGNQLPVNVAVGQPGVDVKGNVLFFADPGSYLLAVNGTVIPIHIDPDQADVDARFTALEGVDTTTQAAIAAETAARTAGDALLIPLTQRAAANGVATLDAGSKIPDGQIPDAVTRDTELATAIAALVNSAPGTLDTLNEIATALGNDPNLATTLTNLIALKVAKAGDTMTGELVLPDVKISGKNGLSPRTLAGRRLSSGAPTTGAWNIDDEVDDSTGQRWRCTAGGTPGTWVQVGASAPDAKVGVLLTADVQGFLPIGIDATNNRVFAISDRANATTLYQTTDADMTAWQPVRDFAGDGALSVTHVFTTAAGTWLVGIVTAGGGAIMRSADSGVTWANVLADSQLGLTQRDICQLPNANLFIGEYVTVGASYTLNLYKSTDDGATWASVHTWSGPGTVRHIHFVRSDPYVTNRLWLGTGDSPSQSFIAYSDDNGANFTLIGNDQSFRAVDVLFTATSLVWGLDNPTTPAPYVYSWDRNTGVKTQVSVLAGNSIYYGGQDSAGRAWFCTVQEGGAQLEASILTGYLDGTRTFRHAIRVPQAVGSTASQIIGFGPTANGSFYWGFTQVLATGKAYRVARGSLYDDDTTSSSPIVPARQVLGGQVPMFPVYHPQSVSGSSMGLGANSRLLLQEIIPTFDFILQLVQVKAFGGFTGNCVVAILDVNPLDGKPRNVLGMSAITAFPGSAIPLQVAITPNPKLTMGRRYWLGFQGSVSTQSLVGAATTFALGRVGGAAFIDGLSFPLPSNVTGQTVTDHTVVFAAACLGLPA